MAYFKMTKKQIKDMERIRAWLKGETFRENSRDRKPQVPDLALERVLEDYVPRYPAESGQFFTPLETGAAAIGELHLHNYYGSDRSDLRVLEPCAGIGNLVWHLRTLAAFGAKVDAYELDGSAARLGQRLFPWANWHNDTPFGHMSKLERQYDFCIANPPFGTTWALAEAEEVCEGRAKRSEHLFLELIIRALKLGGQAVVIAPYNYVDRLPKKLFSWLEKNAVMEWSKGPLPGEFALTSIRVHAFYFRRNCVGRTEEMEKLAKVPAVPDAPATMEFPTKVEVGAGAVQLGLWG